MFVLVFPFSSILIENCFETKHNLITHNVILIDDGLTSLLRVTNHGCLTHDVELDTSDGCYDIGHACDGMAAGFENSGTGITVVAIDGLYCAIAICVTNL